MKCNVRELGHMSAQPCLIEGRLNYKKVSNGGYRNQVYKERWFRLVNNYLFYYKINDVGKFDTKNPAGVFVMENSSIQMEHGQSIPFSFSISFIDEPEKRHIFAARAEDNVVQWVMKLRECSYEYLRFRLHALQSKIFSITGKDPLLLVPRNEGACLWAPSVPFSTVPACTANNKSSFSCHLHTSTFTLERSKSDVQANRLIKLHSQGKTNFYTDIVAKEEKTNGVNKFSLERSKTSALIDDGALPSIMAPNVYSRPAPSPPIRKKSPASRSVEPAKDVQSFTDKSKFLGSTGILDTMPVPPRRKPSSKVGETSNIDIVVTGDVEQNLPDQDLITF